MIVDFSCFLLKGKIWRALNQLTFNNNLRLFSVNFTYSTMSSFNVNNVALANTTLPLNYNQESNRIDSTTPTYIQQPITGPSSSNVFHNVWSRGANITELGVGGRRDQWAPNQRHLPYHSSVFNAPVSGKNSIKFAIN